MVREEVSVLVVDDVNTMRVQIKELLNSFGFRKITAVEGGEAAKAALASNTFHLVLCDWHMEPTDGIAVLKHVRAQPQTKNMAFIMVTAENSMEKVGEAVALGVDDYIIKPLTMETIETKINKVLVKKQVLT